VVSVVGEAGLGKSRLIHEFKDRLAREGGQYLEGSCFAYGESVSYLPFIEVLYLADDAQAGEPGGLLPHPDARPAGRHHRRRHGTERSKTATFDCRSASHRALATSSPFGGSSRVKRRSRQA
jgi:predicted ATPase